MKAVLLIGYGAPEEIKDIPEYYRVISGSRKVHADAIHRLIEKYMAIGGGSPMNRIVREIRDKLQNKLGEEFQVFVAMKNWHPFIEHVVPELEGFEEVIAIPLTPFYSRFHTERYFEKLDGLKVKRVTSWYRLLVDLWVSQIKKCGCPEAPFIFTAHSLPAVPDDPYASEVKWLAEEISRTLGLKSESTQNTPPPHLPPRKAWGEAMEGGIKNSTSASTENFRTNYSWKLAYQSKPMGARGEWLGPQLDEVVSDFVNQGYRELVIVPIGFIHDSLEVLYDLDIELPMKFREAKFFRVETPNSDDGLVEILKSLVL